MFFSPKSKPSNSEDVGTVASVGFQFGPPDVLIPRLAEVSQEVADLERQHEALLAESAALEVEYFDLCREIRSSADATDDDEEKGPKTPRVRELLGLTRLPTKVESREARKATLYAEINHLKEAIAVSSDRVERARGRASVTVCEILRPAHDVLVEEAIAALLSLHAIHARYTDFLEDFSRAGVGKGALRPLDLDELLGPAYDKGGHLGYFLRDCERRGHLSRARFPASLR